MAANDSNSLSVFSVLDVLRRRKFAILIPTLLITGGFAVFAHLQPDRYRATSLIAAAQTTPPEYLRGVAPPPLLIEDHLWTVREVIFSEPVLQDAAKALKRYRGLQGKLSEKALEEFKAGITIKVEGEHTFELSYEAGDPQDSMNVTNKLSELFVQKASANREEKTSEAAGVIGDQLQLLQNRMEKQSKDIHEYKTKAVNALPDHIDDTLRQIDFTQDQLRERDTKISEENAKKASINKELHDLEAKGVLDQPVIQEKVPDEEKLDSLRFQLAELQTRLTPQHPSVVAAKRQISDLERSIAGQSKKPRTDPSPTFLRYSQLKAELEGIDRRSEAYEHDKTELRAQLETLNSRLAATPHNEKVIEDLNRELKVGEMQFHALLDKQLDNKLAKGLQDSDKGVAFTIVEAAGLPSTPYSPKRERILLLGLAAGLGLGLILAFVLEQNDTTFANLDDFQRFTTLPVSGVIPNVDGKKKGRKKPLRIITVDDPASVAAEQYRILAMRVQQQCDAAHAKSMMITSAAGSEGKSVTAINLAVALQAATAGRVLLIDADMRKPRIADYLKLTVPPDQGFHHLLVHGDADPSRYIMKYKDIHVILGGVAHGNPVAALSTPRARDLFERFKKDFSYIVIDTPPVLPIADSHILAGITDRVLLVVRSRQTPRELYQHAIEGFDPASVLGAVLNDVDYQRSRYAYAYEYYKKAA